MNESVHEQLIRMALKREMTPDDRLRIEAALAAHPEAREEWESDAALGRLLAALPETQASSNFTAQVLSAIDLDEQSSNRMAARRHGGWRRWLRLPQLSGACALVLLAGFGAHEYRARERVRQVADVRQVSRDLASLPESLRRPEIFQDFDAIEQLRHVSTVADDELLKVLQQ